MIQAEQSETQIICPKCGQSYTPGGFVARDTEGQPRLKEYGRLCPYCNHFVIAWVEDDRMRRYRATVEQRRVEFERRKTAGNQRAFKRAFDAYSRVYFEAQMAWTEREAA